MKILEESLSERNDVAFEVSRFYGLVPNLVKASLNKIATEVQQMNECLRKFSGDPQKPEFVKALSRDVKSLFRGLV